MPMSSMEWLARALVAKITSIKNPHEGEMNPKILQSNNHLAHKPCVQVLLCTLTKPAKAGP